MAGYTVLANRYRPRVFADVVGQADIALVLERALSSGRAGHAYLFSGPRGVGKTSMARILAKCLNCLENPDGQPCGTCRVCAGIDEAGDALDVVEIDGASHNKVENVRELIDNLRFRPVEARFRIYVVDEVHMLSTSAFNALLKTLEEPPEHAKFILCTTEPLKVPETIRSRCQLFDFRRLSSGEIQERLAFICEAEGVAVPAGLLERVARHAKGGLRDALSLLDQLITFSGGKPAVDDFERLTGRLSPELLHQLLGAALDGDTAATLACGEEAMARGARAADLLGQLTEVLEGVLVLTAGGRAADRSDDEVSALQVLADRTNVDQVTAMLDVLVEAARRLKQHHDARLVVEMAVLTLARLPLLAPITDLLARGSAAAAPAAPRAAGGRGPASSGRSTSRPPGEAPAPKAAPKAAEAAAAAPEAASPEAAAPAAAADAAAGPPGETARAVLEELGKTSRSLRLELQGYASIALEGDELVLVPATEGASGLYAVDPGAFRERVGEAATAALGRRVQVRVSTDGGTKPAGRPPGGKPAAASDDTVRKRVLEEWPGAERVDM